MKNTFHCILLIATCGATAVTCHAKSLAVTANHPFSHVEIAYSHNDCSYMYSPIDFCGERHVSEMKDAIERRTANFNGHYILLNIKEWRPSEYYGDSVVVIDAESGIAYPMPFDYYAGKVNMINSKILKNPKLTFSAGGNKICVDGSILVYRSTTNGHFCFYFDGHKFSGFQTEYMN
ncbi:hypothetical protein QFZ94_000913 [Paraburkholderia sp. JPY465]|uniref:hypothetical protein n=1 Tax=Paraburkholderia sp. JPY465 TaxID=3042285 RepID=UPI003D1CFEF7